MGGASSKPVRKFPKSAKPTWAGTRTPTAASGEVALPRSAPRASETRDEAIERDAGDPQLLANLSKLGPVKVDHHMQTIRPAAHRAQRIFESRLQSEAEARSARLTRNHLLASSLTDLLEERKAVTTREQLQALADRYDIDVERLDSVARFVNSPSVEEGAVKKTVGQDGTERITMKAAWVEPKLKPAPYHG